MTPRWQTAPATTPVEKCAAPDNAPGSLTAEGSDGTLTLTWVAPALVAGADDPITEYEVRWRETAPKSKGWSAWTAIGAMTSHMVEGWTNGNSYAVQVRAKNAHGVGPPATVSATPSATQVPSRLPQVLGGFAYTPSAITFGDAAPAIRAPMGAVGTLTYSASPATVCRVDGTAGALTIDTAGSCEVTATAAMTSTRLVGTATATVTLNELPSPNDCTLTPMVAPDGGCTVSGGDPGATSSGALPRSATRCAPRSSTRRPW